MDAAARAFGALAITGLLIGCTPHPPLVQDATGLDTYAIVRKVRCEFRDAIRETSMNFIARTQPELMIEYRLDNDNFWNIYTNKTTGEVRNYIKRFENSSIAYDFTFDLSERNEESLNVDFFSVATFGVLKVGPTVGSERDRKNTRNFQLIDSFGNLMKNTMDRYCRAARNDREKENFAYPITGNLNLIELTRTFVNLARLDGAFGVDTLRPLNDKGTPAISDTIEFVTVLHGAIEPSFAVAEIQRPTWRLEKIGGKTSAKRSDTHKLLVTLALPPENGVNIIYGAPLVAGLTPQAASAIVAETENRRQRQEQVGRSLDAIARALR